MDFTFADCGNMPMPESKEEADKLLGEMMKKQYEERMKRENGVIRGRSLNEIAAEVHRNAVEHGWWDPEPSFEAVIALCHSELSEALEAKRNREELVWIDDGKPEGIATEMIDCVIRIFDALAAWDVDIEQALEIKHLYNTTRPYRHGDKAL